MTQHILIPHQNPTIKAPSLAYLSNVTANNVEVLKKLHLNLFPVHYSDSFYQQVQNVGEFAKVAYVDGQAVGAICCRLEPEPQLEGKFRVYIMTLGVLEPYRRRKLGHILLQHILDQSELLPTITRVYLHVQVVNTGALQFYHSHGFQQVALVKDYYKHISDKDAYVVVKNVIRLSSLTTSSSTTTSSS